MEIFMNSEISKMLSNCIANDVLKKNVVQMWLKHFTDNNYPKGN